MTTLATPAGAAAGAPAAARSEGVWHAAWRRFMTDRVGGILSGHDAISKIEAGADVVQIYTGLIYKGPALVTEVASALQQMKR